jgi:signal transduction histidine kinase/sensor domain CHASE-containing protein/ActR/RegA family two-component response regulator
MRQSPRHQQIDKPTDSPADEGVRVASHILQLLAIIAGAATVALGLAVMVGWHIDNATMLQLAPTLAPMHYNAALSFVLCGTGLLALTIRRRRVAAVCSTIAGMLGFLTLLEYLFSVSLGIDQLLIKSSIAVQTSHPGRMAPNTALCFTLAGAALWVMSVSSARREQILMLTGPLGSIVLALGLVAGIGYLTGLKTYSWGYFTSMAAHTAVGCVVLGGGLIAFAWQMGATEQATAPQRFAVLVGICGLTVTLCLWQGLIAHEHAQVERTTELVNVSLQNEIIAQIKPRVLSLVRMAKNWEMWGQPAREMWEADAQLYVTHYPDMQGVGWVDPTFHMRWIVPLEDNAELQDRSLAFEERRRTALELAQGSRQITATRTLDLAQGAKGFQVFVPIMTNADFQGFIVGIFRIQEMFDVILGNVALRYAIAVFEGTEEIYGRYHMGRQYEREWGQETALGLYGVTWRLRIWPTPTLLAEELSPLPEVGLAAGLLTSGLLAMAVYLAQTARLRAAQVVSGNQALQHEISEHMRTEISLAARVQQMEAVRAVTLEIGRELDLTSLLSLITQRAINLVEAAGAGAVYLWDEPSQMLIPRAWHGRGDWMQNMRLALGEGIVGAVAQRRTGLIVNDYQRSPSRRPLFAEHFGSTAVVAEPLIYRDRLVGVIALDNQGSTQPFGEEDRQLLALFAAQAAIAIENARLYEALERRFTRLQTLTRLNQIVSSSLDSSRVLSEIARAAATFMDAAVVSFWVVDEATRGLEVQAFSDEAIGANFPTPQLSFDQDAVGWVATHRQPLNVADVFADSRFIGLAWWQAHELRSFFGVPILDEKSLVAVLSMNGRQPFRFGPDGQPLLESFVAQAASAIRNARLFADIQERTAHLARLNTELHTEIAERRQAVEQLQRQQEALFQSEKLAAMGSLLASVAHELNNPLSVVTMQADLLSDEMTDQAEAERVRLISQSAERCVRIVQNFLAFARQTPPQRTEVDLNTVLEGAMELLTYTLRVDDIDIQLHLEDDLPSFWADPHQLHQVVVNLVTNAHQALRETVPPRQLTITTHSDPACARVYLEVVDTGPGIPLELQGRIFEPFFTTKPPGVGTGLGLPFCQGIIEAHGGSIRLESRPGQGARFVVELPAETTPARLSTPTVPDAQPIAEGKAILVVDDEPGITSALAYLLGREGHLVETASNGRLALEKLCERTYDLILCDLRMPELDGPGLYREVERTAPSLLQRMIFLTGDTLSSETRIFLEKAGVPCLSKPFRAADVRRAVWQRLQGYGTIEKA